jgi:GntR family transcriptional regulator
METSTRLIQQRSSFASAHERTRLGLGLFRCVLRVTRIVSVGGSPALEHLVVPLSRVPGLDKEFAATHSLTEIAAHYGLTLGRATERVQRVTASPEVALYLGLNDDQQVIEIDRLTTTNDGVPIEWKIIFLQTR